MKGIIIVERNEIILNKDRYKTEEKFREALATQLQLLFDNDYEVLIRQECANVVVLEFAHDPQGDDWGADRFMLVTSEEADDIEFNREHPTTAETNKDA